MSIFWNKDFRRWLAAFNDLLVMFEKNLDKNLITICSFTNCTHK